MANVEHLRILRSGAANWNVWRLENREIRPNLSDATLRNVDLRGAHLNNAVMQDADLSGADVSRADLGVANLRRAKLNSTILIGANLSNADLRSASFRGARLDESRLRAADLRGADLRDALLRRAVLRHAGLSSVQLENANFKEAQLAETYIDNVDLTTAIGLTEIMHHSPSAVSTSTLEATATGLRLRPDRRGEVNAFLRAAGVPESIVATLSLLIANPIEFYSCFISYSHRDKSFARRTYESLQSSGIRCWLDEHDLKPGDRILDVIDDAIRINDKILLCCSEASLNSWWVKDEIRKALERERRDARDIIIPLMVDPYLLDGWEDGLAADLRSRLAADFAGWEHDNAKFEEQFERVVRALRTDDGHGRRSRS